MKASIQLKTHQELPGMDDDTYGRLVRDIKEHGLEFPIVVDRATNEILDGHHRYHAALEAGVEPAIEYRSFDSEEERTLWTVRVNLLRRDLGPVTKGKLYDAYLYAKGVERGQGARNDTSETSKTVLQVAEELGVTKPTLNASLKLGELLKGHDRLADWVDAGTKVMPQKWAKEIVESQPDLARRIEDGEVGHKAALEEAKKAKAAREKGQGGNAGEAGGSHEAGLAEAGQTKVKDLADRPDLLAEIPRKEMSEGQAEGYRSFERYHALLKHDPEEVALAFDPNYDRERYDTEVGRAEEVIGWMERYHDALLSFAGDR